MEVKCFDLFKNSTVFQCRHEYNSQLVNMMSLRIRHKEKKIYQS